MQINLEIGVIARFRKRVFYILGTIGLVAGLATLCFSLSNTNLTSDEKFVRVTLSFISLLLWLGLLILAQLNKLFLAAGLYCFISALLISIVQLFTNPDIVIYPLYLLALILATAFIRPVACVLYGIGLTLLYITISVLLIQQLPSSTPATVLSAKWLNIGLFAGVLLVASVMLYSLSRVMREVMSSFHRQTEELTRLNLKLQHQHEMEGQIATQVKDLTGVLGQVLQQQKITHQHQSTIISDVATTTQELDAAARRIAGSALSVATVAEKAQKSVEIGQQAAQKGVTSIAAMRERVQSISQNMSLLTLQLDRINEVIGIIGEIADETNLLALNATIEAAGAREYGRRFAAVAEEVQRLARRASNAVEQIQGMVQEINEASSKTVAATQQGLREAQLGDKLVSSLTIANEDVINLVAQTSTLASNIAGSTQQQREASAQIVGLIQNILQISQNMSQATGEVSQIVSQLETSATRLKDEAQSQTVVPGEVSRAHFRLTWRRTRKPQTQTNPLVLEAERRGLLQK